jgi:hypothetical protein
LRQLPALGDVRRWQRLVKVHPVGPRVAVVLGIAAWVDRLVAGRDGRRSGIDSMKFNLCRKLSD